MARGIFAPSRIAKERTILDDTSIVLYAPAVDGGKQQVLRFDGTDDYAYKNSANFDPDAAAWTVEAWIRQTGAVAITLFSCGDQTDTTKPVLRLSLTATGATFYRRTDANAELGEAVACTISMHARHHIVMQWNNANGLVYLDGKYIGATATWTAGALSTEDTAIGIMRRGRTDLSNPFKGAIAQVRTYSRVLDAAEVLANFNAGFKGNPTSVVGLLAWYQFLALSGATLVDLSGNSQDMTISGAIWVQDGKAEVRNNKVATLGAAWTPQGWTFDGTLGYLDLGNETPVQITGAITVLAWVKASAQASKYIACKYDTGANQRSWAILTPATGTKFTVNLSDDGTLDAGHSKQYTSSLTALDGAWHLIGFVFTGSALSLYVDDVQDMAPTKTVDDAIAALKNSTVPVSMGASFNSGVPASFATMTADRPFIANRALSLAEIQQVYLATRGTK